MSKNILIAYFSRPGNNYVNGRIVDLSAGNTEVAVKKIQKLVSGTLFRIVSVRKYPEDYTECTEKAQAELRADVRPELDLTGCPDSINDNDIIILAYPNWWGTMPMPVWTFLEQYDFSGKTILPLCTNEGSGMGRSESDIQKLCPGASLGKGLALRGSRVDRSDEEIKRWLKASGIQ